MFALLSSLLCVCRLVESGNIKPAFMSSVSMLQSACAIVRLVPGYQTVVLCYQLVSRLAEAFEAALKKEVLIYFCIQVWTFNCNILIIHQKDKPLGSGAFPLGWQ